MAPAADPRPYYIEDLCPECHAKMRAMLDWIKRHSPYGRPPAPSAEPTTTPEDTLRAAGISTKRQSKYQRRMSSLLAGR